jgi:hypothetical protein
MVTDDERRWPQGTEFVIVQKKALQKVTAFIFQFTTCDIILKVFYDISEFLF